MPSCISPPPPSPYLPPSSHTNQGLLDKEDLVHVSAFAAVVTPLLQYGLDLLRVAQNAHHVPRVRCEPHSGGIPQVRAARLPHPGEQTRLPAGFDAPAEFELVRDKALRVEGSVMRADPLVGRPAAQARRRALTEPLCGATVRLGWEHLVAGRLGPCIHAFLVYLACV